ncbi:MAG: pseudouridine-5'-phosphate glycosidase [Phycisphaerales bacterium]|nr:pseudouridine-5'-phosphate glycosidase [Phycisphaerales bacterium]
MTMRSVIRTSDEVQSALAEGRAVVALETAAVTHGLPRSPLGQLPLALDDARYDESVRAAFDPSIAINRALGHALAAAVRSAGAVPAVVGMLRGELIVGMTGTELDELAEAKPVTKVSMRDIADVALHRGHGGTTVAATLFACKHATPSPIRFFATGGIGGVHRGWNVTPDISADLLQIAHSGVAIVCAGAKSILDLDATLEALDSLSVPVVGFGTEFFPRFLCEGAPPLRVSSTVIDAGTAAALAAMHFQLRPQSGMLICVPPPSALALPLDEMELAIQSGLQSAAKLGARGPEVTPVLLQAVADATRGRSLEVNLAVLLQNAFVAAQIAVG